MVKSLLFISIISCLIFSSCHSNNTSQYKIELINTSDNAWGYSILSGEKTIIYQQYIPCVAGNIPFSSKADAKKVGQLVLGKLQKNQMPSCTLKELKELNIARL
jgi:hypothetical protein